MYDADVTGRKVWERTIIQDARLASGLTQGELAARAGTSQPTISAYEHGKKTPTLAVAQRLVQVAGWNLGLQPRVTFTAHPMPPGHLFPFFVPDRLWRIEVPACFRTIHFVDLLDEDCHQVWWDLSNRAERKRVYENVLTYSSEESFVLYVDGALLIDLWDELDLAEPIRKAWTPLIGANRAAPAKTDVHFRHEATYRDNVDVVRYVDEPEVR
jgi:transcriptional regulator with XRE-family HTH domain